ncbi:transposase [Pseudomonas aeruginosa]|nr:transposase [Pseudomonas aeruginosa]
MSEYDLESITLNRGEIVIDVGEFVEHRKAIYKIVEMLDFNTVVGVDVESGRAEALAVAEIKNVPKEGSSGMFAHYDLDDIADQGWSKAQKRYQAIEPLLLGERHIKGAVEARAAAVGASTASLYRWLSLYSEGGGFIALIPGRPGWSKGKSRISDELETIIGNCIETVYLTIERNSKKDVHEEVKRVCRLRGIKPPNLSTVHSRIDLIPERVVLRARGFSELASNKYDARPGRLKSDYPLHRIQIDHTPADVIVVDDTHRLSIGRPWVTMAICDYSRMLVGYYISLSAPSAVSVAMCLSHSILPKEEWLAHHNVEGEWPVWGKPRFVHSDNGSDFKTKHLIAAMDAHKIGKEFRPGKNPHWGGKIERKMGNNARIFNHLQGATGRNPSSKGDRKPEKLATMTMEALERWLICKIIEYNNKFHSGIGMAPIKKWRNSFFGKDAICGMPPRPADPWSLQIDFMPKENRLIHNYGVEWDAMYYAEVLRPWINYSNPKSKTKKSFTFRRDPRDVNCIWFYEPNEKKYYKVPIAHKDFPGVSVGEYVEAKRQVIATGKAAVDAEAIERAIAAARKIEFEEAASTKSARREQQKKKTNAKSKSPASVITKSQNITEHKEEPVSILAALSDDDVELFGDVV